MERKVKAVSLLIGASLLIGISYNYSSHSDVQPPTVVDDSKCQNVLESVDCASSSASEPEKTNLKVETVAVPTVLQALSSGDINSKLLENNTDTQGRGNSDQSTQIVVPMSKADIDTTSIQ